jgi:CRP-like cAMP-binding protein
LADPQTVEDLISGVPTFAGLEREQIELIAGCGQTAGFEAGEYLFRADEPADRFFVIRRGLVALELFAPSRGQVIVSTHGPGDVVGWSWLFPPYRWQFDGRASEGTRGISFDGACLRGKCDTDHEFGYVLMQRFALKMLERLQETRVRLLDVYGHAPVA